MKVRQAMATESQNFWDRLMTDNQIFPKMHQFKAAILLYLSSLELKRFVKLKKTIVLLSYQVNEHQGLAGDEKLRDYSLRYYAFLNTKF